jgi:hypothetical protein
MAAQWTHQKGEQIGQSNATNQPGSRTVLVHKKSIINKTSNFLL